MDTTQTYATRQPIADRKGASGDALTIVLASLDPDVQGVWAALRDEGIPSQVATCAEDAAEFLDAAQQRLLVLDSDFPQQEVLTLRERAHASPGLPILWVGSGPDDVAHPAWLTSRLEERIAKPVMTAVLALRIKALALQAGFEFPRPTAATHGANSAGHAERSGSLIAVYGAKEARARARSPSTWLSAWPRASVAKSFWPTRICGMGTSVSC